MAINKKKKKEAEPVTNCDQLGEVDAKCNQLDGAVTKCDLRSFTILMM